jgi:hypothetical protein
MMTILLPKPRYGDQVDADVSTIMLHDASQHPVTEGGDWCGAFAACPEGAGGADV